MIITQRDPRIHSIHRTPTGARVRLTPFALACGYIERAELGDDRKVLESEHSVYHVKSTVGQVRAWSTFRSLGAAYAAYDRIRLDGQQ